MRKAEFCTGVFVTEFVLEVLPHSNKGCSVKYVLTTSVGQGPLTDPSGGPLSTSCADGGYKLNFFHKVFFFFYRI